MTDPQPTGYKTAKNTMGPCPTCGSLVDDNYCSVGPRIDDDMVDRFKREMFLSEVACIERRGNRDLDQRIRDILRAALGQP